MSGARSEIFRQDLFHGKTALGRFGERSDIADLAVFLCSDAPANISGALMVSDGASSAGRNW